MTRGTAAVVGDGSGGAVREKDEKDTSSAWWSASTFLRRLRPLSSSVPVMHSRFSDGTAAECSAATSCDDEEEDEEDEDEEDDRRERKMGRSGSAGDSGLMEGVDDCEKNGDEDDDVGDDEDVDVNDEPTDSG